MPAKRELGRAAPELARILPELPFDMSAGQSSPGPLGKTATPVKVLPELAFDMTVDESAAPPVVIPGRVQNGVVVPQGGPSLPEGAVVSIHFTPQG
jgi:hypothetical protein